MLKQRILTAIIIIPIVILAILYLPNSWFAGLTALLIGWCAWEWSALIKLPSVVTRFIYTLFVVASLALVSIVPKIYWLLLSVCLWVWVYAAILCYAKHCPTLCFGSAIFKGVMGFLFLIPFWLALYMLRSTMVGPWLLIYVFILVWSVDTGAYFAGRSLGKRKLIPRVSPNKTWAGLVGGMALCVIVSVVYSLIMRFTPPQLVAMAILAFITAFFSIVGDLLESMMKRQAEIKDSGSLLPGHGGILDRLDSAIAALPIFALGLILFT